MPDVVRSIPGAHIEVPEFVVLGDFGYSVPGHAPTPKRKWRHARLDFVACEVDDDGINLNFDFLRFCQVRDSAVEVWRLPGCEHGCRGCAHLLESLRDDPELIDDLPSGAKCDRSCWWRVPEGTTTWVPAADHNDSQVQITALPWTDFGNF